MLGAFFCFTIAHLMGFWWALLMAPLGVAVVGGLSRALDASLILQKYAVSTNLYHGHRLYPDGRYPSDMGYDSKTVTAPVVFSPCISPDGIGLSHLLHLSSLSLPDFLRSVCG